MISRFSAPPAPGPFTQMNLAPAAPGQTKVVRIYLGAGYFDHALADKLRPILAKAFASSKPDALKVVPDAAVAAPGKAESRSKLTSAPHPMKLALAGPARSQIEGFFVQAVLPIVKCDFHPEPLRERLYSVEISRAKAFARFPRTRFYARRIDGCHCGDSRSGRSRVPGC